MNAIKFEIQDKNTTLVFQQYPLKMTEWVFLMERLIGVLANSGTDDASAKKSAEFLKQLTGFSDGKNLKEADIIEILPDLVKSLISGLNKLSDSEKENLYNNIMKTCYYLDPRTPAPLDVTMAALNNMIKNPISFYKIIFNCIKGHLSPLSDSAPEISEEAEIVTI